MKRIVIVLWLLMPLVVSAQNSGIKFSTAKTWEEAISQAKAANKPIFVDAFATFCIPCQKMEKEVFTDKSVSDYVNENFIPLRVQMDLPKENATEFVKKWYFEGQRWKHYVTSYPCFLFFTSNGQFAGKEEAYYNAKDFLELVKKNINPNNNYLVKVQNFRDGKLNRKQMLSLALYAKDINDTLADTIAGVYKREYIDPLPLDSLLNPESDKFTEKFNKIFTTRDKIIRFMYEHPKLADSLFERNFEYSETVTDFLILRDYVYSEILPNDISIKTTPSWGKLQKHIAGDFDKKTAARLILNAKIFWAHKHEDFDAITRLEFEKIDKYGADTSLVGRVLLNNLIYNIVFKKIDDVKLLEKAAFFMKNITQIAASNDGHLDTYAAILYKAGHRNQALEVEQTALEIARRRKDEKSARFYADMIGWMRNQEKIWEKKLD